MSDEKRLAEIEARRVDASYESESAGKPDNIEVLVYQDIPWLLARVCELEAQAARDKRVVEAAARLPPGAWRALEQTWRTHGWTDEAQLADAIEDIVAAIAPLMEAE